MTVYSSFLSDDFEGIITNLNGFLGFYEIGIVPGFLFTTFVYLSIMNSINLMDGIDGYLAIFTIFFFISFLFNNSINGFLHSKYNVNCFYCIICYLFKL